MRLLCVALALASILMTAGASCSYTNLKTLPDNKNRKSNESLNNYNTLGKNNVIPTTTQATMIDNDYKISYGTEETTHDTNKNNNSSKSNKNINDNSEVKKQLSTNNNVANHSNINKSYKSVTFDKSTDIDREVVEISTSNNNRSRSNDNNHDYSPSIALENTLKTLQRHQRAIAAVAEQKGLLGGQLGDGGEHVLRRGKRYLQFAKGSRVSWRTTGKNNILRVNTLWAYGYGFRANFPFPGPEETRRPFFKRDVLHSLADILDGHGLDGRACILKSYCTAVLDVDSNISGGMLFKMLKLIFTFNENEKRHFPYLRLDNCKQILHSHCPLSFDSISPYTDDV